LTVCGHRFCWQCLLNCCNEEKVDVTFERCPYCRTAFALDPDVFEIDGILDRFLRTNFPADVKHRQKELDCLKSLISGAYSREPFREIECLIDVKLSKQRKTISQYCGPKCIGNVCVFEGLPPSSRGEIKCCPDCEESLTGECRHMRNVRAGLPSDTKYGSIECCELIEDENRNLVLGVLDLVLSSEFH